MLWPLSYEDKQRSSIKALQKSAQCVGIVAVRQHLPVGGETRLDTHRALEVVTEHLFALPTVPAGHKKAVHERKRKTAECSLSSTSQYSLSVIA